MMWVLNVHEYIKSCLNVKPFCHNGEWCHILMVFVTDLALSTPTQIKYTQQKSTTNGDQFYHIHQRQNKFHEYNQQNFFFSLNHIWALKYVMSKSKIFLLTKYALLPMPAQIQTWIYLFLFFVGLCKKKISNVLRQLFH